MSTVNLYIREEPNIFNEILSCKSCKDSNKNGELIMTRLEPQKHLSILNKTFTFSNLAIYIYQYT